MTIKLIDYGIGEFGIDDVIFSIPFAQEVGKLRESPSVVGKLVPLEKVPNHTLFV